MDFGISPGSLWEFFLWLESLVNGVRPAACAFCRLRLKLFIEKKEIIAMGKYLATMMLVCVNILALACTFAVGFLRPSPSLGELDTLHRRALEDHIVLPKREIT